MIPKSLYQRLQTLSSGESAKSVSDYVVYLLRKSLPHPEATVGALNDDEEEQIRERLRSLGYLD